MNVLSSLLGIYSVPNLQVPLPFLDFYRLRELINWYIGASTRGLSVSGKKSRYSNGAQRAYMQVTYMQVRR